MRKLCQSQKQLAHQGEVVRYCSCSERRQAVEEAKLDDQGMGGIQRLSSSEGKIMSTKSDWVVIFIIIVLVSIAASSFGWMLKRDREYVALMEEHKRLDSSKRELESQYDKMFHDAYPVYKKIFLEEQADEALNQAKKEAKQQACSDNTDNHMSVVTSINTNTIYRYFVSYNVMTKERQSESGSAPLPLWTVIEINTEAKDLNGCSSILGEVMRLTKEQKVVFNLTKDPAWITLNSFQLLEVVPPPEILIEK